MIIGGLTGQFVLPALAMQTRPGPAARVTVMGMVTAWKTVPLMPATVAVYVPGSVDAAVETTTVEATDWPDVRATLAGVIPTVRFALTTVVFKLTVPEKPLILVMLRTDAAEEPAVTARLMGLATIAKSGTLEVTATVAVMVVLVLTCVPDVALIVA